MQTCNQLQNNLKISGTKIILSGSREPLNEVDASKSRNCIRGMHVANGIKFWLITQKSWMQERCPRDIVI